MSFLSALLGLDSSHQAGIAGKQGQAYNAQAATGYQNLQGLGAQQYNAYSQNLIPLLQQLGTAGGFNAGLNTATPGMQIAPPAAPVAPAGSGTFNTLNAAARQDAGAAQAQGNQNPYSLLPHQQEQLNQSVDRISKMAQSDMASLQSEFAKRGITDPRAQQAAAEQIQEHYNRLSTETQTQYYEEARKEKEATIASILSTLIGLSGQGQSAYEQGTQGLAGLGGAQQQQSNILNQQAASAQGGLLNLVGFLAGGGFNRPRTPATAPSSAEAWPVADPGINWGAVGATDPGIFK